MIEIRELVFEYPGHRALAGVTVAAGAEHHDEPALRVRPQRLQRLRQRVGLVGVVDEDRRAVALGDPLQPASCTFEQFEFGEHRRRLAAGADRKARRDQRVLDLELADQRQPDGMIFPAMFKREVLRKAVDVGRDQANALARASTVAADGKQAQLPRARGLDHGMRTLMIG